MATIRDEQAPVSWEEVLLAINPHQGLDDLRIRQFMDAIRESGQGDQSLDPEIEEYLKLLIASSINQEIDAMIRNLFVPRERNSFGLRTRSRSTRNMVVHGGRRAVQLI